MLYLPIDDHSGLARDVSFSHCSILFVCFSSGNLLELTVSSTWEDCYLYHGCYLGYLGMSLAEVSSN